MAEAEAPIPSPPPPSFLEVKCKSSGKTRRFAAGTEAGFAISLINRKLGSGAPPALYIEAIKDGEEAISFGPNSVLLDYGHSWNLQTVTDVDYTGVEHRGEDVVRPKTMQPPKPKKSEYSYLAKKAPKPLISFVYIGKIILAFILIFVLGASFTLFLENLPNLITSVKLYIE
ncbi:hypothetical protein UlMin_023961 [Ulmus minor]